MLLDFRKSPACTRRLIQIADLVRASTGSRSGEVGQRADERWRSGVRKAVVKVMAGRERRRLEMELSRVLESRRCGYEFAIERKRHRTTLGRSG